MQDVATHTDPVNMPCFSWFRSFHLYLTMGLCIRRQINAIMMTGVCVHDTVVYCSVLYLCTYGVYSIGLTLCHVYVYHIIRFTCGVYVSQNFYFCTFRVFANETIADGC